MDFTQLATMAVIVLLFLLVIVIAAVYFKKAATQTKRAKQTNYKTVMYLQTYYDRVRKNSRIPCSILYIKVTTAFEDVIISEETKKAYKFLANTILASFGDDDSMIALCENGDYIVITRLSEPAIEDRINQIRRALKFYSGTDQQAKKLTLYFGAYLLPASNVSFEEAVSRSKLACNEAELRTVPYIAWDYNMQKTRDEAETLDHNFNKGFEENNFFIEFQPIVDLVSGTIIGAEVLTRLSDADSRIIKPAEFLAVIANSGMNLEFDLFVLEKTCKWAAHHRDLMNHLKYISINFSRKTIYNPEISDKILEVLKNYDLSPEKFAVEILEDQAKGEKSSLSATQELRKLRDKGVKILLDDFGTGYTSFEDIQTYPVSILKIDRTIVKNTDSEIGARVFKSIIKIADEIDAEVICEGVEKINQIEFLRDNGCKFVQGFYFYQPMNTSQFESLIRNNKL